MSASDHTPSPTILSRHHLITSYSRLAFSSNKPSHVYNFFSELIIATALLPILSIGSTIELYMASYTDQNLSKS